METLTIDLSTLLFHLFVYYICFNDDDLTYKRYEVNQEWMMTIAYYRGALDEYKNHPVIKNYRTVESL